MTRSVTKKTWSTMAIGRARSARRCPETASTRGTVLALVLALTSVGALASAGCGNYSNEDLEFMSAIPQREDMAIEVPRRGNLVTATTAESWKTTLGVTHTFNGAADAFLSLIEKVRSYYPTSRNANERIWGPYPSKENPGWQVEFHMLKLEPPMPSFEYRLIMIPPAGVTLPSDQPVTQLIGGSFDASGGVRIGQGHLTVTLAEARLAGIVFEKDDKLLELTIDYQTQEWPRTVDMTIVGIADDPADAPGSATYGYMRFENGDGSMTFTFSDDLVKTTLADETMTIQSQWLASGPGRADYTVTGGDTPGGMATGLECWGENFMQTYLAQSWTAATPGDPLTICIPRM